MKILKLWLGIVLFVFASPVSAQGLDLLGGGGLKGIGFIRLSGLGMPQGADEIQEQSIAVSSPVYKDESQDATASLRYAKLATNEERNLLRNYYNIEGALSYSRPQSNGDNWSWSLSYGSASDKPFASSSVSTVSSTYTYTYAPEGTGQWLFFVNYSNNRPILNNIPLPGFAYIYKPSKDFFAVFGAPFATFQWQFTEKLSWGFLSFVPWVLKTNLTYKIAGPIQAYTGLDIAQTTFLREERTIARERVYFDERKLMIGLKSPIHRRIFADFEMGRAFSRRLFEAEEYRLEVPGELRLQPENYIKISLMIFLSDPMSLKLR